MRQIFSSLLNDEAGFLISSELALVSTVGVLGMTVGLSQAAKNVNGELKDVGSAFRSLDQSACWNFPHQSSAPIMDAYGGLH
ncbi:MAG: hypothetical protein KDA80_00785 [Planctomycetaceae bacterium]|nr:hypothetical protein [Planctomycetaceae bacterium]